MSKQQLMINGEVCWELEHYVPMFWPLLFMDKQITESRRLHSTLFQAASCFSEIRKRHKEGEFLGSLFDCFGDLEPDRFSHQLKEPPDTVLTWDLTEVEQQRPYLYEDAMEKLKIFRDAAEPGSEKELLRNLNESALSPIEFTGNTRLDSLALIQGAGELRTPQQERGRTLITALFGNPVSIPARALSSKWVEKADRLNIAEYKEKRSIVSYLIKRITEHYK